MSECNISPVFLFVSFWTKSTFFEKIVSFFLENNLFSSKKRRSFAPIFRFLMIGIVYISPHFA